MTAKILGPIGYEAFDRRKISPETAVRFGIYTARSEGGEVIPDAKGNVVVFPFEDRGTTVNEKYRAPGKKFWQRAGGKRTFWNADALDDPALADGRQALVITEGEIDALTAIDCGFPGFSAFARLGHRCHGAIPSVCCRSPGRSPQLMRVPPDPPSEARLAVACKSGQRQACAVENLCCAMR